MLVLYTRETPCNGENVKKHVLHTFDETIPFENSDRLPPHRSCITIREDTVKSFDAGEGSENRTVDVVACRSILLETVDSAKIKCHIYVCTWRTSVRVPSGTEKVYM